MASNKLLSMIFNGGGAGGSGGLGDILGMLFHANGNVLSNGAVTPFASGGVVDGATPFAMRGGLGVMGEAGPEAIIPLSRGGDGKLGVRMAGGRSTHVTVNIQTPDPTTFRQSQAQVRAGIAKAVSAGQRYL
jgi:lambda family phage tail tape measure protein